MHRCNKTPPAVNKNINPTVYNNEAVNLNDPPYNEALLSLSI